MPQVREDKREKLLELVRNLLRLSESPNEHEAAAAAAKASELLMRYRLDEAEVRGWKTPEAADFVRRGPTPFGAKRVPSWMASLLSVLARHNVCRMTWSSQRGMYTLYGREASILVTQYQLDYMLTVLKGALDAAWKAHEPEAHWVRGRWNRRTGEYSHSGWKPESKALFATSFYHGAVAVLNKRLAEARKQEEQAQAQVTALVVADQQAVSAFYAAETRALTFAKTRQARLGSNAGYQAGRAAGASVSIHTGVHGGGAVPALER